MYPVKSINEKGFTFLTAIFDLFVLLLILQLMALFYGAVVNFAADLDPHRAEWQLFAVDLQSYLHNSQTIEIINEGNGIRVHQKGEEFDIELYANMVRKQKSRKGHEVMLTQVKTSQFSLEGTNLKIRTEFLTGAIEEVEYVFTPALQ